MSKIKWALKQLLPLTYRSSYQINGEPWFSVWVMWFGKVYKHDSFQIVKS